MAKYLIPKETFSCDLGIKTFWEQLAYEVSVEKAEEFGVRMTVFFTKEYIKEHFDIIKK